GLNNAGTLKRQFLVILNDNGMSISKPQGAVAQYFDRFRLNRMYLAFKQSARELLTHLPGGSLLQEAYHKACEATAAMLADRAWDTGICESHALDMMAGLAKTGYKPFFCVYSTFLQRAFDQAFQEVSLQGLAVRLCLDRAGLVGGDGAVHHGFCDVSILRTLPGAALTAAIDEPSLLAALEFMRTYEDGLSAVRDDC